MIIKLPQNLGFGLLAGLGLLATMTAAHIALADATPVEAIAVEISPDHTRQFGLDLAIPELRQRVITNLTEWGYPLPANAAHYHYRLAAELGLIVHQGTPVGLSFSSGNSDPRSPDFQKADVLPITCRLYLTGASQPLAEHSAAYGVHALSAEQGAVKVGEKLADQISTTCLDVLEAQQVAVVGKPAETGVFQPKWLPEMRVEVKTVRPQIPPTTVVTPLNSGNSSQLPTVENANDQNEKEIIIYNQGSPLILKMGHERR